MQTKSQLLANQKYKNKNKEKTMKINYRSKTKKYILELANDKDIEQVKKWIRERKKDTEREEENGEL